MKKNNILPLMFYTKKGTVYIKNIKQVPAPSVKVLLDSMLRPKRSLNKYIQDLSFEMHVIYLFYISFAYKINPETIISNLNLLNERFDVVKQYFHFRISDLDLIINESKEPFEYFSLYRVNKLRLNMLTMKKSIEIISKHNAVVKDLLSSINSPIPKELEEFYIIFEKEIEKYLNILDTKIKGYSLEKRSTVKHRYYYAMLSFRIIFIKGKTS